MGQRVNIQYSVDIDDLQQEVNRLFSNAIVELDKLQPVGGAPVVKLGTEGLDKIDSIRRKLSKNDIMLGDVQNIVESYIRFKTQSEPAREIPFQQPPEPPDLDNIDLESLDSEELQDQIEKFKELYNAKSD